MLAISKKGLRMPESPIRKLVPYAEQAVEKGVKVYQLNIGQPDLPTPKVVLDAVRNIDLKILEYSHSAGFLDYRQALARYYRNNGVEISTSDLIVTTGGSEALSFTMGTIADEGDEIIIPEPFYANYNGFSTAYGVKVVPVTSHLEYNFALPPIEDFESLITEKTRAILICNPGNPTGYLYTREELEKLKDLVIKHDLYLIADEVYREFTYDDQNHISILEFEELEEHAIVIDSVSKRYSMCGARIGCLISRNKEVIHTAMKFAQARLSPPTIEQIAAKAAMDTPSSYFKEVATEYNKRRNVLVNGLNAIEGVECPMPKGAFYCVAKLPVDNADAFARWMLAEFSHEGATVMVAPAEGFYASPNKGLQYVRLAYVLEVEVLEKCLIILEKALQAYPGKL
ncbi:MAG: pyridoxal phosphate-dependent aminotransferase [Cryomorphaceae bacterium]|nr:pyridoxal phosphate-dependent aminotransferase [Cryomorphaceae bacterium]